jgi:diketogulonate reductase-like aldo/keto reductase
VTLANGVSMPRVGYGTWRLTGPALLDHLHHALEAGYRLIDTAQVYRNEGLVGQAVRRAAATSALPRDQLFLTTKVSPRHMGSGEETRASVLASLDALGVAYVDLVLLHWPGAAKVPLQDHERLRTRRQESWRALQALYAEGRVRAIGVSNYTLPHLHDLTAVGGVQPMVNQVECHPLLYDAGCRELLAHCRAHGIHVQAYASLGEGALVTEGEEEEEGKAPLIPGLQAMAARYPGCSQAQVLLRWALEHGFSVLPKSTRSARIQGNIRLDFSLAPADMAELDGLLLAGVGAEGQQVRKRRFCWDPHTVA